MSDKPKIGENTDTSSVCAPSHFGLFGQLTPKHGEYLYSPCSIVIHGQKEFITTSLNRKKVKKLGNIVAQNSDLRLMNKVDFIHYSNDISNIIPDIPTLIIGWNYVKTLYSEIPLSILKENIDEKTRWCFSPMEKNTKHIECVKEFYQHIICKIKNNIPYHFVNIFEISLSDAKKIISVLNSDTRVICYVHYNFMYVYFHGQVFGFNLDDIEYVGISREKVLKYFYNNKRNTIFFKVDFIPNEILNIIKNNMYLIPVFAES